jgi:large subunit ribosomal protein L29
MNPSEMRLLSVEELRSKVADARQEMMNLRFQVVTGQLTDTSRLKQVRRSIAQFETILREQELAKEGKE